VHFSLAENDHLEGSLTAERHLLMRDRSDLPDLAAMDDSIANGTWHRRSGEAEPLALFTAPRANYSLHRLHHYTGTVPDHFQNFVVFTNCWPHSMQWRPSARPRPPRWPWPGRWRGPTSPR
jgi:AMP nucleosidase